MKSAGVILSEPPQLLLFQILTHFYTIFTFKLSSFKEVILAPGSIDSPSSVNHSISFFIHWYHGDAEDIYTHGIS